MGGAIAGRECDCSLEMGDCFGIVITIRTDLREGNVSFRKRWPAVQAFVKEFRGAIGMSLCSYAYPS